MTLRISGLIVAVLSPDVDRALERAAYLGKLEDKGSISMYYRKLSPDRLLTVLVPTTYPQTILDAVSATTIASAACVASWYSMDWRDGELLLLASSASLEAKAVESPVPEKVSAMLKSSGLGEFLVGQKGSCDEALLGIRPKESTKGRGIVVVDRSFTVKGVGLVMLGLTKGGDVGVHDELIAVPSMKPVTVKSVEVLDEPFDEVGADVRVGLALKGASLEEVEDTYMLVEDPDQTVTELKVRVTRFPWSDSVRPGRQYHLAALGIVAPSMASSVDGDGVTFRASRPLPKAERYVIVDVNARPPRPRIIGWAEPLE
ncbi:MAG: hypothetical protein ACP5FT_02650 [Acidilobus sp.]